MISYMYEENIKIKDII